MSGSKILVSLTTKDNDYQRAQAAAIESVARRMNANIEIIYADNDAVNQSQQILSAIQKKNHDLCAVITEPCGTGMTMVAETAAKAGLAWGVLNREIDYARRLTQSHGVPVFEVSVDQVAVGQMHAAQIAKLVPGGGSILYLEGPAAHSAAKLRTQGFMARKQGNIELKVLKGNWTEESGYKSVASWLKLSTSKSHGFTAVLVQNDAMALGARKALSELSDLNERSAWLALPILGCDGLPETGQQYVRRGQLTCTAVCPLAAPIALELYLKAKSTNTGIQERTLAPPTSFPTLDVLKPLSLVAAQK